MQEANPDLLAGLQAVPHHSEPFCQPTEEVEEEIWVEAEEAEEEERNTAVVVLGLMAEEAEAEEDMSQTTTGMRQEAVEETEESMGEEGVQGVSPETTKAGARGKTAPTPEGPAVTMAEEEEDIAKQGRREPAPKVEREEVV